MAILMRMMIQLFKLMEMFVLLTVIMTQLHTTPAVILLLIVQTMTVMMKHFLTQSLSTYIKYLDRMSLMGNLSD